MTKPIELPAPDLGSVILVNGEEQPLGHSDDAMLTYGRACVSAAVAAQAAELEALLAEVQRLQRSLMFWLPKVPAMDGDLADRVSDDAFLLVGYDGDDEPSAEDLGIITFNQDAAYAARAALKEQTPPSQQKEPTE